MEKRAFLSSVEESRTLNSKIFSLIRMQLLAGLADLGPDGATYRELKAWLEAGDGVLYANLKALTGMGYVAREKVMLEGKELELFKITDDGLEEWRRAKAWLREFSAEGGTRNG